MIPFVTIELDRPRKLRFGMAAMVEFEQLTKTKLMDLEEEMSFEIMAKLLWVMLKQEQPDLTLEQACALVDDHADNITVVTQKINEAVAAAFKTGKHSKNG